MIRSKSILRTLIAIVAHVGVGCSLLLDARAALAAERLVWFGTYTGKGTNSEGIYVSKFNDETGELSEAKLAGKATTPSFIALHPTLPMLYSTAEFVGKIEAFYLDESTGMLTPKNGQRVWASHLSVDPTGQVLLAAGGGVTCLGITADGTLKPVAKGKPSGALEHPKGGKEQKSMPPFDLSCRRGKVCDCLRHELQHGIRSCPRRGESHSPVARFNGSQSRRGASSLRDAPRRKIRLLGQPEGLDGDGIFF